MLSPSEIQALYEQGPEAVFSVISTLQEQVTQLAARVKELENRLGKDSHNSSKPPSSDGLAKKPPKTRKPSGRKSGGQHGHPGRTLRPSESPDFVVVHAPSTCSGCGAPLGEVGVAEETRRQVFDVPPVSLFVAEHRAQTKCCPGCGTMNVAGFPEGVLQPVQYGPRIQALCVYLLNYQLLPFARTSELLEDLFGSCPSEGTLMQAVRRISQTISPIEAGIREALRKAEMAHFDETGGRVGGRLWWIHSAGTAALTCYLAHPKRGKTATDAFGILPSFSGVAVHDGWGSYGQYGCSHALCNAHHLRELTGVAEQDGQPWAEEMKRLLLRIKEATERAWNAGEASLSALALEGFLTDYERILQMGFASNPPPAPTPSPPGRGRRKQSRARNLLLRLDQKRDEVLAFMHDFRLPFDNNLAERDLRMMKVHQKIAGCFRTPIGAMDFCRIRGYISTLRKQGQNVLSALQAAFQGEPVWPCLYA